MFTIVSVRVWLQWGWTESLWYVSMIYEFIYCSRLGSSPQGVSHSVERVLEFRIFGEGARVVGILLYRTFSRVAIIITASAKVNAKSDGDGYYGGYSEARRDELGTVRIIVRLLCTDTIRTCKAPPDLWTSQPGHTRQTRDTQRLTRIRFHFRGLFGGSGSHEVQLGPACPSQPGVLVDGNNA